MEHNRSVNKRREINRISCTSVARKLLIVAFWLLVWQLLALFVDNGILLPAPVKALGRLRDLLFTGAFVKPVFGSLCRIAIGFLLGTAAGLVLAVCSSKWKLFEEVIKPAIVLCKTVPIASFVVLLLIWWGSKNLAISVCFLIVLPNIYLGTLEGIRNTDKKLLEMAKVFGLPRGTRFFYIYRPALRPFLNSSLKLALGMCWKSGVAAEVIGTPEFSIGEQLYFSKIHLDMADLFAWTAVIILLSICFEKLILWVVKCFFDWEPACSRPDIAGNVKKRSKENNTQSAENQADMWVGVCHLWKTFDNEKVFEDFNAVYDPGRTYYLTDPSGSGKTTLLRMLAGLECPDQGEILWGIKEAGVDNVVSGDSMIDCSMVFQEDRLCEDYSAVKNVEMVTGDRNKAIKALEQLLEPEALGKSCSQLSGGMKRRVALVRAMEAESSVVLLDEPFTGMDAVTRERAEKYIRQKKEGRILIIATHI